MLPFGSVAQEDMSFRESSYLEFWQSSGSGGNAFLKVSIILSSGSPFAQRSVTICAIFVESIKRNNSVKLF